MDDKDRLRLRTAIAEIMGWVKGTVVSDFGYGTADWWVNSADERQQPYQDTLDRIDISQGESDYFVEWKPDQDIAAAWQVLDYATKIENMATLVNPVTGFPAGSHIAYAWKDLNLWTYSAEEAAEKICLMIYKAVMGRDFE